MTSCTRGCTTRGQHNTECTCTTECPDHDNHCTGCHPRPTTVGHYCQTCADNFRTALTNIPDLAVHVANLPGGRLITRSTATDPTRKATKVDQQSPSPAWDITEEVVMWAQAWAFVVADETHQFGPFKYNPAGIPRRDLTGSINYLLNRLTQILCADYHEDIYREALHNQRQLERASGTDRIVHRIKARCPECKQRTLTREDGSDCVICRNSDCAKVWREDEYDALAQAVAS